MKGVKELVDGYEFELPYDAATASLVANWVDGERRCCPFFAIDFSFDRDTRALRLRLRGQEGVKQVIRSELPSFFEAA